MAAWKGIRALTCKEDIKKAYSPPKTNVIDKCNLGRERWHMHMRMPFMVSNLYFVTKSIELEADRILSVFLSLLSSSATQQVFVSCALSMNRTIKIWLDRWPPETLNTKNYHWPDDREETHGSSLRWYWFSTQWWSHEYGQIVHNACESQRCVDARGSVWSSECSKMTDKRTTNSPYVRMFPRNAE
jgi:hypothetical protein